MKPEKFEGNNNINQQILETPKPLKIKWVLEFNEERYADGVLNNDTCIIWAN